MNQNLTKEDERRLLFVEYCKYMRQFDENFTKSDADSVSYFREQICNPFIEWIDITCENKIVGFMIIGHGIECHRNADYFIMNVYVKPEYQSRGLMTQKLKEYFREHSGVYCLDVLKNNFKALAFWNNLFKGYKQIKLKDYRKMTSDIYLFGYKVKEAR